MSRCFPYPPPGFEPKLKNDHVDLLHKEKHKDKKHKKEKKDKREREEKREKDKHHSKEKHRDNGKDEEKKERKEKHKHKKREKERDKEADKDKNRPQPVVLLPVPTEKSPERILSEHSRRIDEGSQAGPPNQFMERRVSGTSSYGTSEKRPVPVPVQQSVHQSVPSVHRKSNDAVKVGPTSQPTNHRVTVVNGRRVAGTPSSSSPEEGMIAKRTVPSASNSNITNPNSLMQRNSNGPPNQVLNHHGTGFTERRIPDAKKPVPSHLNSLQGKTTGPTSQSTNHPQLPSTGLHNRVAATERGSEAKRVAGNSVLQMQRKTDGYTFQVTNNHQATGLTEKRVGLNHSTVSPSALVKDKDKEKVGLNLRGSEPGPIKQEEGKKEKRKERDEKKDREKELRRLEKKQRKEREKEERKKKKEKERDKMEERDKVKEVVNSIARVSNEGPQRNIEKVGPTDGIISKKRKDGESNGFLHEDDMRAQKLLRTSPPGTPKQKHASTNGFVHENDVQSKFTKKLPPPPHLENGRISNYPPSFPPPSIKPCSSSPRITATNNNPANINTIKAEVSLIKKAPQLNGTVPSAKVHKKRKEEPPHPDLKYLNVVYSVPKLEEKELQPPEDDHGWLFGTKPNRNHNFDPNSTMLESGLSDGPDLVWDRAVRLNSADAFALPYVVPF